MTSKPYNAEIDYLESTGTQYIDSGIECTGDLSVECMVRIAEFGGKIAGGIKVINGKYYRHHMIILPPNTSSRGHIQIYWYQYNALNNASVSITRDVTYSDFINTWLPFSLNAITGAWTFASYSGSVTPLSASLTTGENYAIFGRIGLGTVTTQPCAFKYFKLSRNGVLLRDFIPVRKGTTGYLYDKVSGKLFGNAGTGSFILGPDK